jgi:hypothetical protein
MAICYIDIVTRLELRQAARAATKASTVHNINDLAQRRHVLDLQRGNAFADAQEIAEIADRSVAQCRMIQLKVRNKDQTRQERRDDATAEMRTRHRPAGLAIDEPLDQGRPCADVAKRKLRHHTPVAPRQELLGHTDIKTTAKFYTTATVEDVRQAMKKGSGE